ncbi:hypothetical protein BXY47_1359 [Dietzia kunjamensis]|uniref:hypothetical protein n=1 Tax=Dietzia kunjamensis TaxID=322509 RepID=UPI000E717E43|nr:hypothetical protein [Dietzia kunjamensis]MBB1011869.1 hypothetical protein [Dietzia kunjamensis]RKE65203.1 hypothetical protein BXY47_1359 [Dietzia kunjamensis]
MSSTALRTAAALGAATALTIAGAGVAAATTADSSVDGNTVSVTFTLDGGFIDGDACGALLAPTSTAATLAGQLATATDTNLLATLQNISEAPGVELLKANGSPAVLLGTFADIGVDSATVSATVDSNVYALVTYCSSDDAPGVNPFLLVGDPVEAVMGSVATGSEGDLLGTASAMLGEADGEAGGGLGLDTLSSALGGEAEGELDLAVLSSALGETDAAN